MGLGYCCCCCCQYTTAAVPTTTAAGSACGPVRVIRVATDTAYGIILVVLVLLLPACAVLHGDEGMPVMSM